MGISHIYGLVKTMVINCNEMESRQVTIHSVQKQLLEKCNDLALPSNKTIQITGHKNIRNIVSVNNYSKMNTAQQKQIAMALTKPSGESKFSQIKPRVPQSLSRTMPIHQHMHTAKPH